MLLLLLVIAALVALRLWSKDPVKGFGPRGVFRRRRSEPSPDFQQDDGKDESPVSNEKEAA